MKIITSKELISVGSIKSDSEFKLACREINQAISSVCWADQHRFIINPTRRGNGVVPIKNNFLGSLVENGWEAEVRMNVVDGMRPGPIDAVKTIKRGKIAVEWETGNISSSHRALNKMVVGILQGQLLAGFLVLPHKSLAQYLTDRIGNYEEIEPYFAMYANLRIEKGYLGVYGVEHDEVSEDVVLIPKGKDGNARK